MSVLERRHRSLSPSSYELLASICNAFAVLSTTSCGSGLMEPPPSPFTFTTEHKRLVWTGSRQNVRACEHTQEGMLSLAFARRLSQAHTPAWRLAPNRVQTSPVLLERFGCWRRAGARLEPDGKPCDTSGVHAPRCDTEQPAQERPQEQRSRARPARHPTTGEKAVLPFRAKRLVQALPTRASSDADMMKTLRLTDPLKPSRPPLSTSPYPGARDEDVCVRL